MPFLDFLTGKKSYMHATFATDQWRSSLPSMTFGPVFSAIQDEMLWVLESTVKDEDLRLTMAENLAKGAEWISNQCVIACVANTHVRHLPTVRWLDGIDNYDILCIPTAAVSLEDQREYAEGVPQEWGSHMSKESVMEYIDLAVTRWYATKTKPGTMLVIHLEDAGKFFFVPKSQTLEFMNGLGLPNGLHSLLQ